MKKLCASVLLCLSSAVLAVPTAQEGYQHAARTMDINDLLYLHKQCTHKKIKKVEFCAEINSAVLKRKFDGDIKEYLKWRGKGP